MELVLSEAVRRFKTGAGNDWTGRYYDRHRVCVSLLSEGSSLVSSKTLVIVSRHINNHTIRHLFWML